MVWISTGRFNMIMVRLLVGLAASVGTAGAAVAISVVGLVFEAVLAGPVEVIFAVLVEVVVLVAVAPVAAFDWVGLDQPAQN